MRKILALLSITLMLGCVEKTEEKTWLYILPVGCTDNLWQQDWVVAHDMNFSTYPFDQDAQLFQEFLKTRNITILEFAAEPYPISQEFEDCTSCSCPRGDIYRVLVPAEEVEKANKAGLSQVLGEVACNTADDCIIAVDCCGCGKGGIQKPINKNHKKQWDGHLDCSIAKCSGRPSNYPYCNTSLKLSCKYGQCHLT